MENLDYYCHSNILDVLELIDQINYLSTCRVFYTKLMIKKLDCRCLNQTIITNNIFKNITSLNANYNGSISDVSFIKTLKILYASNCNIEQKGIRGLDLIRLNINRNKKITNVSFMKNLKILHAGFDCSIEQNG
jgi:hypothetical protein